MKADFEGCGQALEGSVTVNNRAGRRLMSDLGNIRREVRKRYRELWNWRPGDDLTRQPSCQATRVPIFGSLGSRVGLNCVFPPAVNTVFRN